MSRIQKPHVNVLPGSAGRLSGIDFSSNDFRSGASIGEAAKIFKRDIQGQQYSFVKATEGHGYTNPYFASEWKILGDNVKQGKMALRAAYHFLTPGSSSDGKAQAKRFLDVVGIHGKQPAGTKLVLDWEMAAANTPGVLKGAADYIHQVTGQWPIVYTNSANEPVARQMVPKAPRWEAAYGAHYRGIGDQGGKILPSKGDTFVQYSDGRGYGLPYDMNVFNGSLADLRKFAGFGGKPSPSPSPNPQPTPTPAPAPAPSPAPGRHPNYRKEPTVQMGAHGAAVTTLQKRLDALGYGAGTADGSFGPQTLAAVQSFQMDRGLGADGVVGPQTWKALESSKKAGGGGGVGGGKFSAKARAQMRALEQTAQSFAQGRRPLGWCLKKVEDYLDQLSYGKIGHGHIPRFGFAHEFADYLNSGNRYKSLGLQKLNIHNPYAAPPGSIIVVRHGTPGTHHPTAGDIVVKGPGSHFYNDGEMGYGGPGNFPPGNSYVLGIYAPV